jgi:hypothetical protein
MIRSSRYCVNSRSAAAIPCDKLDPVSEPCTGDPIRQWFGHRDAAAAAFLELHQKIDRSYKTEGGAAVLRPCKVFGPSCTRMLPVKYFRMIARQNTMSQPRQNAQMLAPDGAIA